MATNCIGSCRRLWHRNAHLCHPAVLLLLLLAASSPSAAVAAGPHEHASVPAGRRRFDVPLVTGCGRGGTHATAAILQELGVNAQHEGFAGAQGVSVGWFYGAPVGPMEKLPWSAAPSGRYPFERDASARKRQLRNFSPVVLLVRHPLDVIGSVRRCFCAIGLRNGTELSAISDSHSWSFVESKLNVTRFLPGITSWAALPVDSLLRAMVYWAGWNTLVEETHTMHLAGYDNDHDEGDSEYTHAAHGTGDEQRRERRLWRVKRSANHTVQLEDPYMPLRLTKLLDLPHAVQNQAERDRMHNTQDGKSAVDDATRAATRASWSDVNAADRVLAQRIWAMAQRFGYETEQPSQLAKFLRL